MTKNELDNIRKIHGEDFDYYSIPAYIRKRDKMIPPPSPTLKDDILITKRMLRGNQLLVDDFLGEQIGIEAEERYHEGNLEPYKFVVVIWGALGTFLWVISQLP